MQCPSRESIQRYLDEVMSDEERTGTEEHLGHCLACLQILDEMTAPRDLPIVFALPAPISRDQRSGLFANPATELGPPHSHLSAVPPQRIGRYRVDRFLGKGGFGEVFLAYDEELERRVAVKAPYGLLLVNSATGSHFFDEARAVANLDHPNIVPVYDIGSSDAYPFFIVSKFIDGMDLATHLKKTKVSIHQAVDLIAAIAGALHYAHKRGFVHRDVKPSNILIDDQRKPYLADFGLALRDAEFGKGPIMAGTPCYMSPEQARTGAAIFSAWVLSSTRFSRADGHSKEIPCRRFSTKSQRRKPNPYGRSTTQSPRN